MMNGPNYDHIDFAPYNPTGAERFDDDTLSYRWNSSLCGEVDLRREDGSRCPMLCIITAPLRAWAAGKTTSWETWIVFDGREGEISARSLARWLLRGDPNAPLRIDGPVTLYVGRKHAALPCWRRFAQAAPEVVERMPSLNDTRPRPVVGRGDREARPVADAGRLAHAGRATPDGGR